MGKRLTDRRSIPAPVGLSADPTPIFSDYRAAARAATIPPIPDRDRMGSWRIAGNVRTRGISWFDVHR
jgi:hypothetical protein